MIDGDYSCIEKISFDAKILIFELKEKRGHKHEFEGLPIYHCHHETNKKEMIDKLKIKICKEIIFKCENEEEEGKTQAWKIC